MSLRNHVSLIGYLGETPVVQELDGGGIVTNFGLATSDNYKNKSGELVKQTDWHKIVIWGNLCRVAERYLEKGSMVSVSGKIKTRTYQDSEGTTMYVTEILVDKLVMLSAKKTEHKADGEASSEEDDLPF